MNPHYDTIVVGAGHAGVECALAIARAGYSVLVLTMDTEAVARMSCNPAIGGLAKGHMVREIDAMGGEMGLAIDATGIQFRMLNRSRGPAVWAPRAQADKKQYSLYMTRKVSGERNIDLKQGQAVEIIVQNGKCKGIVTKNGETIRSEAVVLTTGTFLQGLIHIGEVNYEGGRRDEPPAVGLSESLRQNGLQSMRFKTGTPPRLDGESICWDILELQPGDNPPEPFSFRTEKLNVTQHPCYITYTNQKTHKIIRDNLHRSPLYAGRIVGTGPRYCPSIEDKVVKFADKERHQIYLEPEGVDTQEIYVNGMSTSLPKEIQEEFIHTIPGLEEAKIVRWGYAIEYDCFMPTQLKHSLETKKIENLFLAGQINCTSGYEEAAAQGLMAGLNVIRKLQGKAEFVLDRSEAYIGVLIDDLVTRGTNEPYRMFTSRAEFRLLLRQDNADERLMKYGHEFGLIEALFYEQMLKRHDDVRREIKTLKKTSYKNTTLEKYLKRPEIDYNYLISNKLHSSKLTDRDRQKVEIEVKYEGYIARQILEIKKFKKVEHKKIPEQIDYSLVRGISKEAQEKLAKIRPVSLGQASRIPGISACDLSVISVHVQRMLAEK
ncbi:MAG: tRNA uridine-5-carboxymethylaminomethyl(34) synthesis enzyme MnmG [Candidatus Omnitrophica bacterium]|nr:tRNA uridine-5-carboxymethylaminomethyl(34) synthesis enzyme MnmG [Candidatus Omnitrophota bacterium]